MITQRADLTVRLSVERMAPVSSAPAGQGQSSRGKGEGGSRRQASEQPSVEVLDEGEDATPHRIDSLA